MSIFAALAALEGVSLATSGVTMSEPSSQPQDNSLSHAAGLVATLGLSAAAADSAPMQSVPNNASKGGPSLDV